MHNETATERIFQVLVDFGRPAHVREVVGRFREKHPFDTISDGTIGTSLSAMLKSGRYKFRVRRVQAGVYEAVQDAPVIVSAAAVAAASEGPPSDEQEYQYLLALVLAGKDRFGKIKTRRDARKAITNMIGKMHAFRDKDEYEAEAQQYLQRVCGKGFI